MEVILVYPILVLSEFFFLLGTGSVTSYPLDPKRED